MALSVPTNQQQQPAPYGYDHWGNPLPAPGSWNNVNPTTGQIIAPPTDSLTPVSGQPLPPSTMPQAPAAPAPPAPSDPTPTYSQPSAPAPAQTPFQAPAPVDLGGPAGIPYIPPTPTPGAPPTFTGPAYTPPPAFSYQDWTAPTVDEALNDPGYQFRLQQGQQSLQNWAAARGTLNDSGTAKALTDYGQNSASQEYQNVWNRDFNAYSTGRANALDTYNTNYKTQYADPWAISYQNDTAAFAPQMAGYEATNTAQNLGYSTQAAAGQHANDMNYLNAWNSNLFDYQKSQDYFNNLFKYATA